MKDDVKSERRCWGRGILVRPVTWFLGFSIFSVASCPASREPTATMDPPSRPGSGTALPRPRRPASPARSLLPGPGLYPNSPGILSTGETRETKPNSSPYPLTSFSQIKVQRLKIQRKMINELVLLYTFSRVHAHLWKDFGGMSKSFARSYRLRRDLYCRECSPGK